MSRSILCLVIVAWVLTGCESTQDDEEISPESEIEAASGEEEGEGDGTVNLSSDQQEAAGIVTEVLSPQALEVVLRAPGEVRLNAYSTYQVTPRIRAQVVERHTRLGDPVDEGQPLVTLSSVEMAEAQGTLVVADREWTRVQGLGREVVSDRRYIEAEVAAQQARARALAYGMIDEQIEALVRGGDASLADGSFTLLSPAQGTVVRDDFIVGEAIEPGRMMFEIADESTLWVEARIPAQEAATVTVGNSARVDVAGRFIEGRVIQAYHALDESTRTLPIRVEIPNPEDDLHPGLFVDVRILDEDSEPVLAVPEAAVLRSADGRWQVFIASGVNEFEPVEVTVERTGSGFAVIDGVVPGTRVVTEGSFFLQSELGKSSFADDDD